MSRMRNMLDYARSRLERFDERGFCTVDSLILSWVAYTRLPAGDSDLAPARGWEGVRLADLHRAEHFDAYVDRKYADKVRIAQRAHPLGEYHGPSRDGFANQTKKASDADRDRRTKAAPVVPPTAPGHSLFDGLG